MAPPDRSDVPRDYAPLEEAKLAIQDAAIKSRLLPNAERLVSWLEWLLHPEEHEYDRTVTHPFGEKREERGPVAPPTDQPGTVPSDAQLPFESVIEGYQIWQFLHGMTAVATQQVERPDSVLSAANAALQNIRLTSDTYMASLGRELDESEWSGDARNNASLFINRLVNAVVELRKIADELCVLIMKYAVLLAGTRDDLNKAAAELVNAFETKFYTRREDIEIDISGIVLGGIATAAVTLMTGGTLIAAEAAAMAALWSNTFTQAADGLLKSTSTLNQISGPLWRDLAHHYMHAQAEIMHDAKATVDALNESVKSLITIFDSPRGPIHELLNTPYGS